MSKNEPENIASIKIIRCIHSGSPPCEGGGGAGFLNSTKSEGNQNFSKSMGRGERGKEEFLKFSFGVGEGGVGGIAGDETLNRKENFRMNLKMFS